MRPVAQPVVSAIRAAAVKLRTVDIQHFLNMGTFLGAWLGAEARHFTLSGGALISFGV
ncbi:protein of unknown function [Pseudomonas sp. JV551A1]|nr:protein of unknown function [Pseudomonas sp. JV551A1]